MSGLKEYLCPCCNGAVEFNSSTQNMKCPFCDAEFDIDALQAPKEESTVQNDMSWESAGEQWSAGETDGLRVYTCNTCGGEIVAEETTGASSCPYCGNPVIMTGQFAGDLKPDLVIPFKVDKDGAIAALKEHYKGKRLLPRVFRDENTIREIKGMYVPVWLFDTEAEADIRFKGTRTRTWSDNQYRYTETSYYSIARAGTLAFENVPVDGSEKMDDALMESIEPYDLKDGVDFRTAYLSGYLADKYDIDAQGAIERANERIRKSTESAFAATVHNYSGVVAEDSNIQLQNGRARYALYPVWILTTRWNDQTFTFAINGQTGKIAGDLPMDKGMYRKWLFGVAGIAAAAIMGLTYLFQVL